MVRSGYMAPEYAIYGQFSAKSDMFSLGVLFLEIISGQKINTGIRHGEKVEHLLSFVSFSFLLTISLSLSLELYIRKLFLLSCYCTNGTCEVTNLSIEHIHAGMAKLERRNNCKYCRSYIKQRFTK